MKPKPPSPAAVKTSPGRRVRLNTALLLSAMAAMAAMAGAADATSAASASAAAPTSPGAVIEGQTFAPRAAVAGKDLRLNGTGLRAVAWFKGFVAGLYLSGRASTPAEVLAQPGPKRLQLRMLQDVPAAEFVKALQKGIERNASDSERVALAPRVQRFADLISATGTVRKGSVIDLDLDPARGLLFTLNGTLRGAPVEGADFYAALLRAFIGQRPYDERLKAGLLGQPAQ